MSKLILMGILVQIFLIGIWIGRRKAPITSITLGGILIYFFLFYISLGMLLSRFRHLIDPTIGRL